MAHNQYTIKLAWKQREAMQGCPGLLVLVSLAIAVPGAQLMSLNRWYSCVQVVALVAQAFMRQTRSHIVIMVCRGESHALCLYNERAVCVIRKDQSPVQVVALVDQAFMAGAQRHTVKLVMKRLKATQGRMREEPKATKPRKVC